MINNKKHHSILMIEDNPGDFALVGKFLSGHLFAPIIEQAISILSTNKTSHLVTQYGKSFQYNAQLPAFLDFRFFP